MRVFFGKQLKLTRQKLFYEFIWLIVVFFVFSSTIISLKSRKHRTKEKKIIVEGKRLIHDALSSGCKPLMIFFSNPSDLENLNLPEGIKLYKTSYKSLQLWSNVVTSQGILGKNYFSPSLLNKVNFLLTF